MKRGILLFGVLFLSIGIGLGGFAFTSIEGGISKGALQVPTSQIDVKDAENIPLYPNAEAVEVDGDPRVGRNTRFTTADPFEKVLAFYKDILPRHGWILVRDGTYPTYRWMDPQRTTAWGLHLDITIEVLTNGETIAHLKLFRWPEEGKVPLYPAAAEVDVDQTKNVDGLPLRITTYNVKATPQAVEDYYKEVLQEQGWKFEVGESRPISYKPGLLFRALYQKGRNLWIVAQADKDGLTRVEIKLLEYEISLPHP